MGAAHTGLCVYAEVTMSDGTCIDCEQCGLRDLCLPGQMAVEHHERLNQLRIRRGRAVAGQWLYRPGETVRSLFTLRSGCAKEIGVSHHDASQNTECILGFSLAGEVLGLTRLDNAANDSGVQVIADSYYCEIPWISFRQLCAESRQASDELLRLLARSAHAAQQTIMLLRSKDALGQLAGFLCNLSERFAQRGRHPLEFRLSMSRLDIAHHLGLTAETVSRCFSELARRGLIEVHAKQMHLLKPQALQRLFRNDLEPDISAPAIAAG